MAKQTFTTGQVLTAAQVNSLNANDYNQTVSVKTAAYTLVAADKGTRIEFNTSGSVTCTVNTGLFDAGDTLVIQNRGAGVVTVTAGTATVNTSATLALSQYDAGTLYFVSASAAIFFNTDAGGGSPLTTKGDLYTFSTVDARLGVGANNTVLTADSAEATGLKWAAASAASFVGCQLTNSSPISTSNNTLTSLTFDTEKFDTDGFHSTVTNTSRVTIPSGKGGKYLFTVKIVWQGNSTGVRYVEFFKNGTDRHRVFTIQATSAGNPDVTAYTASFVFNLVATDYIEARVLQTSGGSLTVLGLSDGAAEEFYFTAQYLGA